MTKLRFLPWQIKAATHFLQGQDNLGHAWLIHGSKGIGKLNFAMIISACLLCEESASEFACGKCISCNWILNKNHPDLRILKPESVKINQSFKGFWYEDTHHSVSYSKKKLSKEIRINQIRELESWVNITTHRENWKIILIFPAESLNEISGNSLLKVLEEPPQKTLFFLVSHSPDFLLPTLVSRCHRLFLATPNKEISANWLKDTHKIRGDFLAVNGGTPLSALYRADKNESSYPLWVASLIKTLANGNKSMFREFSKVFEKETSIQWIEVLQCICFDLILLRIGSEIHYYTVLENSLKSIASHINLMDVLNMFRWLCHQKIIIDQPINQKFLFYIALRRFENICLNLRD